MSNLTDKKLEKLVQQAVKNYVPTRYLTQKQAVKYTGTSPATINEWVKRGLKVVLLDEGAWPKYDVQDLDDFMSKHKV